MLRYRLLTVGIIIAITVIVGFAGSRITGMHAPVIEAYNQNNLIRLHVIANSNSGLDQTVKIKVRDRIIKLMEPLLIKVKEPKKAALVITQNLKRIEEAAASELRGNGLNMPVRVSLKEEYFPERAYPFGTLPAGRYQGVSVTLGQGSGRNWWCVLYPPLCLLSPDAPTFKKAGQEPVKVEYRLKLLEKLVKNKGLAMDEFWDGWAKYFGIL